MANLRTNNLSGEQGQNAYRGSVFFDGADDYLLFTDSSDFALGTGDFTVEAWFLVSSNLDYRSLIDTRTSVNDDWMIGMRSNDRIYVYSGAFLLESSTGAVTPGHWHHVAYVRSSGTHALYLNGVSVATSSTSKDYDSQKLGISVPPYNLGAEEFSGYVSNVRIVKGTALYTGTFTPPRSELTAVDGTVVLCCQDSNDPTQEATGKTITANGNLATAGYLETQPKVIPPYGVDAGNAFGGPIQQSTQGYMYFPTGRTEERGRGRGVIFGGYSSPTGYTQDIYYLDIQSMGNAVHFGDITATRYSGGGCGSSTRGIIGGGRAGSDSNRVNIIEYVEIAITSNSLDFGDLTGVNAFNPGGGNQTRGIWMGGSSPTTLDVIEYVTIASKGDAIDFGNLRAASYAPATAASPTRMLAMGGGAPSSFFDYIDYVEIATTGNAQDFGDLTQDRNQNTGVSSNTRAVAIAGARSPAISNVIDFVTIATTGNATDFGDTLGTYEHTGSVNNSIRGVICGARTPSYLNILESITIATTGNSTDFGDIPRDNLAYVVGASDSHGGLS
mgnify:CR=1 FL=1